MNILIAVLIMIGVVLLILGICALCIWFERSFPANDYDERQQIARGKGYRFSCYITLLYYAAVSIYVATADPSSAVTSSLMMAGLVVMLLALELYCLLNRVGLAKWVNPVSTIVCFFGIGATQLGRAIYRLLFEEELYTTTAGAYANMFWGVSFIVLGTAHLIAYLRRDKE